MKNPQIERIIKRASKILIKNQKIIIDMSKKILLLLVLCLPPVTSYSKSINPSDVQRSLITINQKLPITYNNSITREKVEFDYKNMYIINRYTLINEQIIQKYQNNVYKQNVISKNKEFVCEKDSSSNRLNKNGVGFKYIYYDFEYKELFRFRIKPYEC